jgi:hypothetical protein
MVMSKYLRFQILMFFASDYYNDKKQFCVIDCVSPQVYVVTVCLVHSNKFGTGRTRNFIIMFLILAAAHAVTMNS